MPSPPDRSPFNRPRWTEQDARGVLAALHRSGKAVRVFAAEHGLDPQRVYLWRRRLGGAELTTFQELMVRPAAGRTAANADGTGFEIVLASGMWFACRPPSMGRHWVACSRFSRRSVRAESAAERATVRRDTARRWAQGP
jgi:hypothetical protein